MHAYEGGYAAYVLAKAERDRLAGVIAERRDNLLRKELAWLRRGPPARTSKPKFRIDAANALIADEPPARDDVELMRVRDHPARQGRRRPRSTPASQLGDRVLLDHVTWRLAPGERIGIVGVNGAGKSTLLRALAGEVPLDGRQAQGRQDRAPGLPHRRRCASSRRGATWRVIEAIEDVRAVDAAGRQGDQRRASSRSGSGSPGRASRPGSATCPVASGGGCS